MANLCIKTPISASSVLIFQLLVLRPRTNDHQSRLIVHGVFKEPNLAKIWKWLIGNLDSRFKVSWFMPPIYLFLFGQTTSRTRYSRVKKMTTKLSMRSMTRTMRGKSTRPFSSFWSSSAVEMMKVTVEITTSREVWFVLFHLMLLLKQGNTMKREKRARTWASLLVQGYSIVLHSQDRHWNKKMWYRKHLKRTTYIY